MTATPSRTLTCAPVFGGCSHYAVSQTTAPLSDLFAYNFNNSKWTNVTATSAHITAEAAHRANLGGSGRRSGGSNGADDGSSSSGGDPAALPEARLAHAADAIPSSSPGSGGGTGSTQTSKTDMLVFGGVVFDPTAIVSQILDDSLWICAFNFEPSAMG